MGGEEAAIVGGDVQAGIAFVNGAEQAPEVEPDGPGIVRVAVLEGVLEGFGGQQAAVFAKGAEQNAVQQLLNAAEDFADEPVRRARSVVNQPGRRLKLCQELRGQAGHTRLTVRA